MKLVLATNNRGKIAEIKNILSGLGVDILTLADFPNIVMPPETGAGFRENALAKARHVSDQTGQFALADDSGLEVDALGGRPGVYSARYAGQGATDKDNYARLLEEMKGVPFEKRTARFRCAIALAGPSGEESVFEGALDGLITDEPRGDRGFGYDPVFYIPALARTAAELAPQEKNEISHRGAALRKFKEHIKSRARPSTKP